MSAMDGTPLDLTGDVDGAETVPRRYTAGCAPGIDVELWTMRGGAHVPDFNAEYTRQILDWLFAHRR